MRKIDELIWHCAATPEGREVSVEEIRQWHLDRGWRDIGYHKLVHLDGTVSEGRPESEIGAHVRGHNTGTIGYCYVGGVDANDVKKAKDTRTPQQKKTMLRLTKAAIKKHDLKRVSGHHDYAAKACPSFPARAEYAHLLPERKLSEIDVTTVRHGDRGWQVEAVQKRLRELGYPVRVDGLYGDKTRKQVAAFQLDEEITVDGIAGPETMKALETAVPLDKGARGTVTAKDLKKEGSRVVAKGDAVAKTGGATAVAGGAAKAAEEAGWLEWGQSLIGKGQSIKTIIGSGADLLQFALSLWWVVLPIVGLLVWYWAKEIQEDEVQAHRENRNL